MNDPKRFKFSFETKGDPDVLEKYLKGLIYPDNRPAPVMARGGYLLNEVKVESSDENGTRWELEIVCLATSDG